MYYWWTSCRSCWSGQRFSSTSHLMFSIAMHRGKKSPWTSHPSAVMISCDVLTCSIHVIQQRHLILCSMIYRYIYTGAGHIIRISSKSWFISLIPFKKWNLYNVYIHSTQTDIFQVFISFKFDDYNWQLMKTPNSVSQKIWILLKTNTKKGFLEILANWKVWTWKVWACTALNT